MNKMQRAFIAVIALYALSFTSCPMEPPPGGGAREWWLDPRLPGTWRFTFSGNYEECVITPINPPDVNGDIQPQGEGENLKYGTLVFGHDGWSMDGSGEPGYHVGFAGDIVYAAAFRTTRGDDTSAGIIIIKYWPGYENKWPWWSEAPAGWAEQGYRPVGKNYYGIYYINMWANGRQVFLACTNEQATNYGPTETATLEEAIAKFTEANVNNLLNLDVGDPQDRYYGTTGWQGFEGLE